MACMHCECYLIVLQQHVIEPQRLYDQGPSLGKSNSIDICWAIWYCQPLPNGKYRLYLLANQCLVNTAMKSITEHFKFGVFISEIQTKTIHRTLRKILFANFGNRMDFDWCVRSNVPCRRRLVCSFKNFETFELSKGEQSYKIQQQHQ